MKSSTANTIVAAFNSNLTVSWDSPVDSYRFTLEPKSRDSMTGYLRITAPDMDSEGLLIEIHQVRCECRHLTLYTIGGYELVFNLGDSE